MVTIKKIAIEYKFLKWRKILSILQQKVKHKISNIGNEEQKAQEEVARKQEEKENEEHNGEIEITQ